MSPIFYGEFHREQAAEAGITFKSGQVHSSGAELEELARVIDEGRVRVAIDSVFPIADAVLAHKRAEQGHVQGKIVLRVIDEANSSPGRQ